MANEQLPKQLRLVMERQGALDNALKQERQARAEAGQRLSVALGEVGGRADAAVATASAGASSTPVGVSSSSMMGCIDTRLSGKQDKFDGQDSCWRDWKFITKAYIQAALLEICTLLVEAEETSDVRNVVLSASEQALSVQLYFLLALLTKNQALDKVQAAGEGEGLGAWRGLQEQEELKSRSRFTSMLLGILNGRFKGDAQKDIESWERDIRSFEKQTSFAISDFVKVIYRCRRNPCGWKGPRSPGRRSCQRTPCPWTWTLCASRAKARRRARRTWRRAPTASPRAPRKWSAKKSDSLRRKADLEKAKAEGRPAVPP